ncbi:protein NATD1-like [Polyodon spathula]|uniref:protein NATD1-like n=1 Tax=Polyodon spathula TaxID=7913 RepID=UPI001B7EE948|nr:protein NATD1-like [Polyodon spathula]
MALKSFLSKTKIFRKFDFLSCRSSCSPSSSSIFTVKHDREKQRFTIKLEHDTSEQAVLYYEYTGNKKVNLLSTVVPTEFRGKGIGKRLAEAAMDFVVEENLKADVSCWYIKQYVEENPLPNYKDHISN